MRKETPPPIAAAPSVGRIVRYVDHGGAVLAAIVTGVFGDLATLTVFYPERDPAALPFAVKHSAARTPETWHWPERP